MPDITLIRNIILYISSISVALMVCLCVFRLVLGPRAEDRMIAFDAVLMRMIVLLCMLPLFFDGELVPGDPVNGVDGICVICIAVSFAARGAVMMRGSTGSTRSVSTVNPLRGAGGDVR